MRFLFFLLLSALPAFGQSSVALTSLDVTASLSEKNREWSGSVRTVLWKENTGKKFSFLGRIAIVHCGMALTEG